MLVGRHFAHPGRYFRREFRVLAELRAAMPDIWTGYIDLKRRNSLDFVEYPCKLTKFLRAVVSAMRG